MKPIAFVLAAALGAAGCSTPAVTPDSVYLLHGSAPSEGGLAEAPAHVGLGRIKVAPYLSTDDGLVVETRAGVIRIATKHRWAEPLGEGVRTALRGEISRALGWPIQAGVIGDRDFDLVVELHIERFHGTMSGEAEMEAAYRIARRGSVAQASSFRFTRSVPLARPGYDALVEAQRALVRGLAGEIAAAIEARSGPRPATGSR